MNYRNTIIGAVVVVIAFSAGGALAKGMYIGAGIGNTVDDSGTDFFWGLGAGVHLGPIGARLEWESVEGGGSDNLSMMSLSAKLGF